MMEVFLVNDGPVTMILDSKKDDESSETGAMVNSLNSNIELEKKFHP